MDKRIERTKKFILDALSQLLEEKKIEDISVTELCKKADINRSTFYLHYDSVVDACKEVERVFANDFVEWYEQCEEEGIADNIEKFVYSLTVFIKQRGGQLLGLYSWPYRNRQSMVISNAFLFCLKEKWLKKFIDDPSKLDATYAFIFDGSKTLFHYMITKREGYTVDTVARYLSDILEKLLL